MGYFHYPFINAAQRSAHAVHCLLCVSVTNECTHQNPPILITHIGSLMWHATHHPPLTACHTCPAARKPNSWGIVNICSCRVSPVTQKRQQQQQQWQFDARSRDNNIKATATTRVGGAPICALTAKEDGVLAPNLG